MCRKRSEFETRRSRISNGRTYARASILVGKHSDEVEKDADDVEQVPARHGRDSIPPLGPEPSRDLMEGHGIPWKPEVKV